MKISGIDIGSRYIKYVFLEDSRFLEFQRRDTGHNPLSVCRELLDYNKPDKLVATGYGRHLLEVHGNVKTITEIKAVAKGANEIFPNCRTIIDIGGQDTKVISLDEDGAVINFEMNDRCAAGTGRFLEIMAKGLNYNIEDFGNNYNNETIMLHSDTNDNENNPPSPPFSKGGMGGFSGETRIVKINSLCTVFAESEVISLITKGEKRELIAHAIHESIVNRVVALIKRIDVKDDIVFAGGCAKNPCLKKMLEKRLKKHIYVHENPYFHAAYGAALFAERE
ncbi:MAG: BadF/BadG/BcrA/BcrD ATPase family protein [Nitrospirota bacterium]